MITSCEFKFGFWDVGARADARFTVENQQPWADIAGLNGKEPAEHPDTATLEPDFGWPLDGTKAVFPKNTGEHSWGWWSAALCGEDGVFENPPTLTINFTNRHSSAGITLLFSATLPKLINVKWYAQDGALIADRDFYPEEMTCFCDQQADDYTKIVITVYSMTRPLRYLRCTHILFGVLETIGSSRVKKAELTEELDPALLTLPIQTIRLSFYTPGGRLKLLDPSGTYRFFQWKQQLEAFAVVDGERRDMGVFYLQEACGLEDSMAELRLVDSVGILDTIQYDGGIYENTPVSSILNELLTPEDFYYELAPAFSGVTVSGHLPVCTKREALRQIAFAIGALVDTTRGAALRIYPAPSELSHSIGPDRKITGHKATLEELVTHAHVTAHTYKLESGAREITRTTLAAGRHTINHHTPALVTQVTGASIITNHPNFTVINVPSAGEVVITGRIYADTTSIHTAQLDTVPPGTRSSALSITGCTLLTADRAAAAAQRILNYYLRRHTGEGRILPGSDTERVGQLVELKSIGGKSILGAIERLTTDLSGGHISKISVRGTAV